MIVPIKTGNLATKQARQGSIFSSSKRLQMTDSIDLTVQSLQAHAVEHDHWCIAWSGGKDSSATLTLIMWLLDSGRIPRPKSLTVFYADTRMELPPLAIAALINEWYRLHIADGGPADATQEELIAEAMAEEALGGGFSYPPGRA